MKRAAHPRLLARLGLVFDLFARVERKGPGAQNNTGQSGSATVIVAAQVPAQRAALDGDEVVMGDGQKTIARHEWTLQGEFSAIKAGHKIIECDANGGALGSYTVLLANVDPLGLTTLKTSGLN